MKTQTFKYRKKNGEENEYELLVLNESTDYLKGIDLNKLNDDEKIKVKEIVKTFEEQLKPYMKAFRQFIVENIINESSDKKK